VLNLDAVVQGFRDQLGNKLDSVSFKKLSMALDVNNKGYIERNQFNDLMAQASNYSGHATSSPAKPQSKSYDSPGKSTKTGKTWQATASAKSPGINRKATFLANKLKEMKKTKTKPEMVAPKNRLSPQ